VNVRLFSDLSLAIRPKFIYNFFHAVKFMFIQFLMSSAADLSVSIGNIVDLLKMECRLQSPLLTGQFRETLIMLVEKCPLIFVCFKFVLALCHSGILKSSLHGSE